MRAAHMLILAAALSAAPAAHADEWFAQDKAMHFVATTLASTTVLAATGSSQLAFWSVIGVGLVKELQDHRQPGNKFSGKDMVFNLAGAAIGSGIAPRMTVQFLNGTVYFSNTWSF